MKNLDVNVSSAIGLNSPVAGHAVLKAPPPPSIDAPEAERRLKHQQDLLDPAKGPERAHMQMVRHLARTDPYMRAARHNSEATGLLVAEVDLRRGDSRLTGNAPCIEADLHHYGIKFDLDTRDMLYSEPCWINAFATCWLLDSRRIMTARHVITDSGARTALIAGTLRVVFGYEMNANNRPFDVFCADTQVYSVKATSTLPGTPGDDWIILELTGPADAGGLREPLAVSRSTLTADTPVYSLGHPNCVSLRYAHTALPLVMEDPRFSAHVDAYACSSGSPVFSALTHQVVGMVLRSKQSAGRVEVDQSGRWISLMSFPEYVDKATLCCNSAAFVGSI